MSPAAETLFATALYFALEGRRPAGRLEVAELLWPDVGERRAQHNLRQTLYKLNAMGAALRSDRTRILLPARSVDADAVRMLAAKHGTELEALAEEIRGPFLPGYAPAFSQRFAEWVERKRDVVHSALRRVFVGAIAARRQRGEWSGAEALAVQCLAIDPLNEEATLAVAEAAAMLGSKVRALSILDRYLLDIGSGARELRVPATALRRRIAEVYDGEPLPVRRIPLIGREQEMAELMRALALAGDGQGSAIYVWGEPGMGKTRLTTEFTRAAALQRVQIARVGCQSHDERRPMSAFVDVVPKLLELPGAIGCSPDTMKYVKRLVQHDPAATALSPDSREAEQLFANIRKAFFDLLDAIAAEGRLIVVIEDVHWLDRMSWELLWDMVGWVGTRRIVVVVTSRRHLAAHTPSNPEYPHFITIGLRPLHETASRQLLRLLMEGSGRPRTDDFVNWCVSLGSGSPYYLIELADSAHGDGSTFQVPTSLSRLINDRLSRLSATGKRLLQVCALLGRSSTLDRVERVLGEDRIQLLAALEELERYALIEGDGTAIACTHELLSTAALTQLSPLSTRLLHRHAAEALEADAASQQSPALIWECAEHWQLSGDRERAIELLRSCARNLVELGLPAEAVGLYERAVAFGPTGGSAIELMQEHLTALQLADRWEGVAEAIERLKRTREQQNVPDAPYSGEELIAIEARFRTGEAIADCYDRLTRCVHDAGAPAEYRTRAGLLHLIVADNAYISDGAIATATAAIAAAGEGRAPSPALTQLRLIFCCSFGDVAAVPGVAAELVQAANTQESPAAASRLLRHASAALEVAGEVSRASEIARHAIAVAEGAGLPHATIAASIRLANLSITQGDYASAQRLLADARQLAPRCKGRSALAALFELGAKIAIHFRRRDEAAELLRELSTPEFMIDTPRGRIQLLALSTDYRTVCEGWRPTPKRVDELQKACELCWSFVGHDYLVAVTCEALLLRGMTAEAGSLAAQYVSRFRRERSPLPARLRIIASQPSSLASNASS